MHNARQQPIDSPAHDQQRPASGPPTYVEPAPQSRVRVLLALLVLVCAGALLSDYARRATPFALVGFVHRARDLTVLALLLWSAATLGARGLKQLAVAPASKLFQALLELGLGFMAQYAVATLLAICQAFYPVTLGAVIGAPLVLLRDDARQVARQARALIPSSLAFTPTTCVMGVLALCYAVLALAPPSSVDPLTYHLVIPRDYLAHGGASRLYDNAFHGAPPAMSMLYAYLMALGSDVVAKLLHALFGLLLLLLLFDRAQAFWSKPVAVWACVLFAAQWSMQHAVQRANVDLHFAFFTVASFFILLEPWGQRAQQLSPRWAALSGLLIGTAACSKVQTVSSVFGSEIMLVTLLVRRQLSWRGLVLFHVAAFAVYIPTLLRNLLFSVDLPLQTLAGLLGVDTGADPEEVLRVQLFSSWKRLFMVELTPQTFALTPLLLYTTGSFPSTNFDAFIDPFYLISVVACLGLVRTDRRLGGALVYVGAFYVVWLATAGLTRYAFPVLPLLAVFTAYTFEWLIRSSGRHQGWLRRGFFAVVLGFALVSAGSMAMNDSQQLAANIPGFFEVTNRLDYLRMTASGVIDTLAATKVMDDRDVARTGAPAPEDNRAFMVFDSQGYYLNRRYYNDPWYVNLLLLERAERAGTDPVAWLRAHHYRYVLMDYGRVPWLRNAHRPSPLLNPYPDALARLESMLRYWKTRIEPRLTLQKRLGRLTVYEIPDA